MTNPSRDIKMSPFIADADPISTGPKWEKWMDEFETRLRYFRITDDQDKLDALKIYGGRDIREKIKHLRDITPDDSAEGAEEERVNTPAYTAAVEKLNGYYIPLKNTAHARFRFGNLRQTEGETINQYEVRLREASQYCDFNDTDEQILYHLALTITDTEFRRQAMDKKYDLQKFLQKAQSREDTHRRAEEIEAKKERQVNKVLSYKPRPNTQRSQPRNRRFSKENKSKSDCSFCNVDHQQGRHNCPASGVQCNNCGGYGHFAVKCLKPRSHGSKNNYRKHSRVKEVYEADVSDSDCVYKTWIQNSDKDEFSSTVKIYVNGVKVQFEIDTGSSSNLLDEDRFKKIQDRLDNKNKLKLLPTNTKLYTYGDNIVPVVGCFHATVTCQNNTKTDMVKFIVVKGAVRSSPLLSLETSVSLGLIQFNKQVHNVQPSCSTVENIVDNFSDIFTGLGKHTKYKASFIVDNSVIPVIQKQRKVPYNLEDKAVAEEKRLMDQDIIEDVPSNEATSWCTNPVIATKPHKPDSIRYCVNMRPVNIAIKRPITEAHTVEDIAFKLNGAQHFSKLDMNESYHQIELEETSRHLTTFYGVNGKKRYKRLNYGAISSQDIFDDIMYKTVGDIPGVINIRDDIIVYGSTIQNHNQALQSVFERFRECGLTLNKSKCKFMSSQIDFFGFVFSDQGMKADPEKIATIQQLQIPKSVSEVRSFLSMLAFSSRFIPQFSTISTPLRKLTEKNAVMKWGQTEQQAFDELKSSLSRDLTLSYYSIVLPTRVYVDASPTGIAAMLAQKQNGFWHPILFTSRSLTKVEQRYSQIEREALGARWACERLYMYVIGSKFEIVTDHQPLLPLFNNPNSRPPIRLERWLLYLQQFEFQLIYEKGKFNPADYLSRHPDPHSDDDKHFYKHCEETVRAIIKQCSLPAVTLKEVHDETIKDNTLIKLRKYIFNGGERYCHADPDTRQYAAIFNELSIIDDIILRSDKVLMPEKLRRKVVELSHDGHQGMTLTKQLLRSKVWFPQMDKMVDSEIKNCIPCQAATPEHNRDPLIMSTLPNRPWERVCVDFCGPFPTGEYALVIIDEYSRYPVVEIVTSTSFRVVKPQLQKIFALFGIPKFLKSDNGPPFNGFEFKQYLKDIGSKHSPVTPLWPEANGMAERFMKPLVKFAQTVNIEGADWRSEIHSFLLNYRATPRSSTGKSPYEMFMKRIVNTKLPTFQVDVPENLEYLAKDTKKKEEIKEYADKKRHVKPHKFIVGNPVLVKIKKKCKLTTPYDPQPYVVVRVKGTMITATRLSDGKNITRNASHYKLLEIPMRSVIAISDKLNSHSVDEEDETNLDDIIKNSTLLDYNSRDKNKSDRSKKDSVFSDPYQSVACENENTVSDNNPSDQEQIIINNGNQVDTNTEDVQGTNINPTRKSVRIKRAPEKFKDYVVDFKPKK